ncbi:MAG TPA: 5-oxoprolinase subunit PxpA [Burkholderiales bacterium]|nr:5-oxoprolinase subunit PxpA [Burkholderiales bacterium]
METERNVKTVDLNCDMGESYGAWKMGDDAAVMPHITSANIACGFHGGDPATIRRTVRLALEHGVAIGAHPSLPDIQGFGRRVMKISPQEMYDLVVYQAGAVEAFARAAGSKLHHIKCHGALYNMAANDEALSEAMVRAARDLGSVMLYALSNSRNYEIAKKLGVPVAGEVFADRGYSDDGTLAPRDRPGGMIEDAAQSVRQALGMIEDGVVVSLGGKRVPVAADTLCLHGDQPGAAKFAAELRKTFKQKGIQVAAP